MHSKTRANILCKKCTTNTRINKMQKYRAFFKSFICMDMNNQIIANHPRLSVNEKTSYKKPDTYHLVLSTVQCNYTYKNIPTCTCK